MHSGKDSDQQVSWFRYFYRISQNRHQYQLPEARPGGRCCGNDDGLLKICRNSQGKIPVFKMHKVVIRLTSHGGVWPAGSRSEAPHPRPRSWVLSKLRISEAKSSPFLLGFSAERHDCHPSFTSGHSFKMRFTTPSRLLLLQGTALFSCAAALCRPAWASNDALLATLRSAEAGVFFCSAFLGVPLATVSATVTPTTPVTMVRRLI